MKPNPNLNPSTIPFVIPEHGLPEPMMAAPLFHFNIFFFFFFFFFFALASVVVRSFLFSFT